MNNLARHPGSFLVFLWISLSCSQTFAFDRLRDVPARFDFSADIYNQVDQKQTWTCLYNTMASVIEFGMHRLKGRWVDVSEPSVLAMFRHSLETDMGFEQVALEDLNSVSGVLANDRMPVTAYYTASATFSDVFNSASYGVAQDQSNLLAIPFETHGERLFWYGRNNVGFAGDTGYNQIVEWLYTRKLPVLVSQMYTAPDNVKYWHIVLAIGYDPGADRLYIHDSLDGNSSIKGSWRDSAFLNTVYGAFGVSYTLR